MVVEVGEDRAVHWMSPTDASEQVLLDPATFANVVHPGTFNAAFLDGRVQSINSKIDPNTLRAMISIAGQDDKAAAEAAQ
jgi:prepilin-type processing-associated H-X9-DG protein